jgi:cyclophilin family peptidyl-prolyl cis-trans isomerase
MPRCPLALLLLAALTLAACGSSGKKNTAKHAPAASAPAPGATTTTTTTTTAAKTAKDSAGCDQVSAPRPKGPTKLSAPKLALSASKQYTVTLKTNCGTVSVSLDVKRAPKTASSFAALVEQGFYDDLTFHRIVPGFVIQGGDPEGTGEGGPGYQVVEAPPHSLRYTRGIVAMAKTGTDPSGASGSQFFIVTGSQAAQLPPDYALVGKVTGSFAAVDRISAEPADPTSGVPSSPVVIEKATLNTGG